MAIFYIFSIYQFYISKWFINLWSLRLSNDCRTQKGQIRLLSLHRKVFFRLLQSRLPDNNLYNQNVISIYK